MKQYSLHDAIMHEVEEMIANGKKRITVLMPKGSGVSLLMGRIIQSMQRTSVVIVSQQALQNHMIQRKEELFGACSVSVLTENDFCSDHSVLPKSSQQNSSTSFFLFDSTPSGREEIAKRIPEEATVFSFGSDPRIKGASFESVSIYPFECSVFYSESILDIRDIIVASGSERQSIIDQITDKRNRQKKFRFAIAASGPLASPEASPEELAILQKRIEERDRIIEEKDEKIDFLEKLLASAGISVDDINKSHDFIKKLKSESDKSEEASEKIAKAIAEQSRLLFAPYITPFNKEYYSSIIQARITENVWNKLCKESQTCLITGKIAFQSMINTNDDSLDYSGVCILASKALDIEMTKRFFHNYVSYLQRTHAQSSWPNTLFDKDNNLLTDDKFTLGSIRYVVGIDENGVVKNSYVNRLFIEYAKKELYISSLPMAKIKQRLRNCIEIIELVRERYRNPAAHRTPLNQVTAKDCFDYLVDTYKKLKEILEVMN